MKIAIFSDCYLDLTGGIVTSINSQKAELEKLGHTVYIFTTAFSKSEQELKKFAKKNIYIVPSCKFLIRGVTPISRRPPIIEKWIMDKHPEIKNFDIFYTHHEVGCSIAGLRLGKKLHIPTVQVMHGREDMGETMLIPFGFRTITAMLLNYSHACFIPHHDKVHRDENLADTFAKAKMWTLMVNHANHADYVISPSEHMQRKLQHYGVKREIMIFPNGLDDQSFPAKVSPKSLKSGEELRIIWHSRVSGEKRIIPFFRALNQVTGKYRLDVYGGGGDLKKAKRYAKNHRLNVYFHGPTDFKEVQTAIQNAQLDVLTSYNYDNHPLTLVEAEACGVPVFFCDPDMAEFVPAGGFLVSKNESPAEMSETISNIFKHPECIHKMSEVMISHRDEVLVSHRIRVLERFFQEISNHQQSSKRSK